MADTYTKIADLIDPEVMGDMVSARIPKKLRVAPFAKVDDTLAGVPGDTITVPAYAYIGDADIVAEGEAVTSWPWPLPPRSITTAWMCCRPLP